MDTLYAGHDCGKYYKVISPPTSLALILSFTISKSKMLLTHTVSVARTLGNMGNQQTSLMLIKTTSLAQRSTLNTPHHTSCTGFRWRTCIAYSALLKHILKCVRVCFSSSVNRENTFNKSKLITKLSHFLFSPYRNWFSSLEMSPLAPGS